MEIDKRVESLEGEFKLMRGELKQTLTSVRDYLLNLKLPPSQEATLLAAAMSGGSSDMSMDGRFSLDRDNGKNSPENDLLGDASGENGDEAEKDEQDSDQSAQPEDELAEAAEESDETEPAEQPEDELLPDEITEPARGMPAGTGAPPVNLLANLIRWVAYAKKEIGSEQLSAFLEVYGISGHLTPESRDTILHLAGVTLAETGDAGTAEVWSRLILELHGILAGGEAPLQPLAPVVPHIARKKTGNSKLKLVLSDDEGKDHQFSLELKPNLD